MNLRLRGKLKELNQRMERVLEGVKYQIVFNKRLSKNKSEVDILTKQKEVDTEVEIISYFIFQ